MKPALLVLAWDLFCILTHAQFVGIGTPTPGSGLEIRGTGLGAQQRITDPSSGNSLVLQGGAGGNLKITGYNYGTGTAQALYLSVDGANTYLNTNGGNVGIGTISPGSPLTVNANGFGIEHTNGTVRLNTFINASGGWIGTLSNHPLNFYTNNSLQQMTLTTTGQLGIGTTAPTFGYLLDVAGPVKTVGNSTHFVAQTTGGTNSWARFYMRSGNSPNFTQSWFIGTSRDFNGNQLYIADETNNQSRLTIQPAGGPLLVQGNINQNAGSYGLPKAMVYLNGDGTILRCYNGTNNATTGGCGFTSKRTGGSSGSYSITFPFNISSSFFAVSVENSLSPQPNVTYHIRGPGELGVIVVVDGNLLTDRPVMVLVY